MKKLLLSIGALATVVAPVAAVVACSSDDDSSSNTNADKTIAAQKKKIEDSNVDDAIKTAAITALDKVKDAKGLVEYYKNTAYKAWQTAVGNTGATAVDPLASEKTAAIAKINAMSELENKASSISTINSATTVEKINGAIADAKNILAIQARPNLEKLEFGGAYKDGSTQYAVKSLNKWVFVTTKHTNGSGDAGTRTYVVPANMLDNGKGTKRGDDVKVVDDSFNAELNANDLELSDAVVSLKATGAIFTTNEAGKANINSDKFAEVWGISNSDNGDQFKTVMKQQLTDATKADDTKLGTLFDELKVLFQAAA